MARSTSADRSTRRAPDPATRWRRATLAALLVGALLVAFVVVAAKEGTLSSYRPGWTVILQDEFDDEGLDDRIWNAEDLPSFRNNEQQYYTPDLVDVRDGRLRLTSERTPRGGRPFSSAAVDTYGKFSFTHGRVEVRLKLPAMGQGVWPAVWMLGTGCSPTGGPCPWPTAGSNEIDIMEAVNVPSRIFTDLHHGTNVGASLSTGAEEHPGEDLSARFSTFAVEWEHGGMIRWYRDGDLLSERTVAGAFDAPMYLIINTAVGGNWPGPPSADTVFPQHLEVDFVRVYQRS